MRRYLLAGLIAAMMATAALAYAQIGGDDGRNDDGGDTGALRWRGDLGLVDIGFPLPDSPVPTATPPPAPTAIPGPTDGPEPSEPEPAAAAASASPAGPSATPAPERGEPPPQPEPAVGALGGDVVEVIHEVFGQNAGAALAVVWCETGETMNPYSVGEERERGLFQIHPIHWHWMDEGRLFDPLYNAQIAYELSAGGMDWTPWRFCQP